LGNDVHDFEPSQATLNDAQASIESIRDEMDIDPLPVACDQMDDERGRILTGEEVSRLREDLLVVPTIYKFPSRHAGAPVSNLRKSIYSSYQDKVGAMYENVYTPFQSKRDWLVAEWAKMHGPGSTSASELMGIDGVSLFCIFDLVLDDSKSN
jgi:hypothetical protein